MKAVILSSCLLVLLVVVTVESQTICGRYVCQENQYCYSPYPAYNRCYVYRNFGQTCYQSGLYLCGPGHKCVLVRGQRGVCRYEETTTTTATTSTTVTPETANPVGYAPTTVPSGEDF